MPPIRRSEPRPRRRSAPRAAAACSRFGAAFGYDFLRLRLPLGLEALDEALRLGNFLLGKGAELGELVFDEFLETASLGFRAFLELGEGDILEFFGLDPGLFEAPRELVLEGGLAGFDADRGGLGLRLGALYRLDRARRCACPRRPGARP